jgi:hypothetical protein
MASMKKRLLALAVSMSSCELARSTVSGFSQSTALPALRHMTDAA